MKYDVYTFEKVAVGTVDCEPANLLTTLKEKFSAANVPGARLFDDGAGNGDYIVYDVDTAPVSPLFSVEKVSGAKTSYDVFRFEKKFAGGLTCEPLKHVAALREVGYLQQVTLRNGIAHVSGDYGNGNYLVCDAAVWPNTPLVLLVLREASPQ